MLDLPEEILHSDSAHWWSPSGQHIAYLKFNDSHVPLYKFPYYGEGSNIYGTIREVAYPKVGNRA